MIDGFTCCVGPVYIAYLERSLPTWSETLDSLTVATRPDDGDTISVCKKYPNVRVVATDVFKAHGADFNKGAALVQAYAAMAPRDWVLHFDSDIMPDLTWRPLAERHASVGAIHGALRYRENGTLIVDDGPWPYGYFQLWHSKDPVAQHWPLFEVWHPHCGSYDLEFLEKWPRGQWRKLPFNVTHFGEIKRNWFGVGLEPDEQAIAFRKMDEVHKVGLRNTRIRARDSKYRLKVPDFALNLAISAGADHRWVHQVSRACMTDDPFLVSLRVGEIPRWYEKLVPGTPATVIRARVEKALAERKSLARA